MDIEKWFEPIKAGHIMASLFYDSPIDFTLIGTQRRMWSRFSGDTARISPRGNSAVVSCQVSIGLRLALDSFRMLFFSCSTHVGNAREKVSVASPPAAHLPRKCFGWKRLEELPNRFHQSPAARSEPSRATLSHRFFFLLQKALSNFTDSHLIVPRLT